MTQNQTEELAKVREQYGKLVEHLSDIELLNALKSSKKLGKTLPEYIVWEFQYKLNKTNMNRLVWKMGYSINDMSMTIPNPITSGLKKNHNEFMDALTKFMNSHNEIIEKLLP